MKRVYTASMKPEAEPSFATLGSLFHRATVQELDDSSRYVIFSDLHLGNGSRSDDFLPNAAMFTRVLSDYLEKGYHLVLNGDIEELLRFSLHEIRKRWAPVYQLLDAFRDAGRLHKLYGNHDLELAEMDNLDYPVHEALRFLYKGKSLLVYHGHQVSSTTSKYNAFITFVLRYIATPLGIRNYSVSHHSEKKYSVEKKVYHYSASRKIISIIGHTHRPLFESLSKYDSLRFEIERLCRKYPKAGTKKQKAIEQEVAGLRHELAGMIEKPSKLDYRSSLYNDSLIVPCIFNSGTVIGKRGMTCLAISDGAMELVHWFDETRNVEAVSRPGQPAKGLSGTTYHYRIIKHESLDYIFSRIGLLGGV